MNKENNWKDKEIYYDVAVVIGRFQPVHNGHLELFKEAHKIAKKTLILIGSAFSPSDIKNPFTYPSRYVQIGYAMESLEYSEFSVEPLHDFIYSDPEWLRQVQDIINKYCFVKEKVVFVGHHKDGSSYYLDMFPEYDFHEVKNLEMLNSTTIRDIMFSTKMLPSNVMPKKVENYIHSNFIKDRGSKFANLVEEYDFIKKYKEQFINLPYKPYFVTTDAVIINSGNILLVKRKMAPGKGLWALPGGFLGQDEFVRDSMIREVLEETRIKLPVEKLYSGIRDSKVFDAPNRSLRGRTLTHAFLISLYEKKNPRVRGSDDAEYAKWFSISDFRNMEHLMFEDHYSIGSYFINRA